MEIFEPFLDLNNLKFVGKSNGMHEFSSKQLFIIVSYFVYEMYHCAIVQRPRNYLSCRSCCSSPFGSFPHKKEFK